MLLDRGDRVRVFDNFSTGKPENLSGLNGPLEVIIGDLRDSSQILSAVRGMHYIFHQAAFVSVPLSLTDPETCFDINVQGTISLLRAAREFDVERIVLASSAAIYGDADNLPLQEGEPPRPLSPYAASKLTNEVYAQVYTQAFNLPVVSLRYFNVFGPRQSPDSDYAAAIPIFIRQYLNSEQPTIFGDGHQGRDFIFVEDVARANIHASEHQNAVGSVFNICTGEEITIGDLVATLAAIFGRDSNPIYADSRPGDIYRSVGDPRSARKVIQFSPQVSLKEGLARTVDWMRR
jgi:nucleoside-diphosphate-sugar epimerase